MAVEEIKFSGQYPNFSKKTAVFLHVIMWLSVNFCVEKSFTINTKVLNKTNFFRWVRLCQGNLDWCQGKVREMSWNFVLPSLYEPWLLLARQNHTCPPSTNWSDNRPQTADNYSKHSRTTLVPHLPTEVTDRPPTADNYCKYSITTLVPHLPTEATTGLRLLTTTVSTAEPHWSPIYQLK